MSDINGNSANDNTRRLDRIEAVIQGMITLAQMQSKAIQEQSEAFSRQRHEFLERVGN